MMMILTVVMKITLATMIVTVKMMKMVIMTRR